MKRSTSSSRILFLASVGLGVLLASGALAEDAPSPSPGSKGPAAAKSASKDEPAPAEMVLCRSPRGAVFARDAKVGCKFGARLGPSNLVDFAGGGASGCSLHPVGDAAKGGCDALCSAAAPGSSCVVGVGRAADGSWTSFGRDTGVAELAAAGGQVVCCRSRVPAAK